VLSGPVQPESVLVYTLMKMVFTHVHRVAGPLPLWIRTCQIALLSQLDLLWDLAKPEYSSINSLYQRTSLIMPHSLGQLRAAQAAEAAYKAISFKIGVHKAVGDGTQIRPRQIPEVTQDERHSDVTQGRLTAAPTFLIGSDRHYAIAVKREHTSKPMIRDSLPLSLKMCKTSPRFTPFSCPDSLR
jgi:hypothetical protein